MRPIYGGAHFSYVSHIARRRPYASKPQAQLAMTEHEVKDQDDQQNAADSDSASITIAPVPKAAAEQQQDDQEDQEQVHLSFPWWLRKALSFYRAPFANAQSGRVSSMGQPLRRKKYARSIGLRATGL